MNQRLMVINAGKNNKRLRSELSRQQGQAFLAQSGWTNYAPANQMSFFPNAFNPWQSAGGYALGIKASPIARIA